jgi:ornithine decarboxylase
MTFSLVGRRFFPRIEPFYAVKCNPDPVVVKTLAILGCNFDCASRNEIRLVQEVTRDLPRKPEIIYANPCKARAHLIEAVCKGVRMVTFDNVTEVEKCAAVCKKIELIMRIITDDRGSQCRLSSKFGAPRQKWRPLLAAAKKNGLNVAGVSFHVGSGCRDATRYELALKDAREIFDLAKNEYGMDMRIVDIGGGFPGETHSMWNPAVELDEETEVDKIEGKPTADDEEDRFMFFTEIAEQVAPIIDELFPANSGVRVIGEPGRYLVAACATLCCSVVGKFP